MPSEIRVTYWPALVLCFGSAIVQYYQSKQLMVTDKNAPKLRDIMRGASSGRQADQSEITAAVTRNYPILYPNHGLYCYY